MLTSIKYTFLMFLDVMTGEELLNEYHKDLPEIQRMQMDIDQSPYITSLLKKKWKQGKAHFNTTRMTSRGNKYLFVMVYEKKVKIGGNGSMWQWSSYSLGFMESHKCTFILTFYDEFGIAALMQPHFFFRYKERFSKVCDWKTKAKLMACDSLLDIISLYVRRNNKVVHLFGDVKTLKNHKGKGVYHILSPIPDGAALYQYNGKHLCANTYISQADYSKAQKKAIGNANAEKMFEEMSRVSEEQSRREATEVAMAYQRAFGRDITMI